MFVCLVFGLFGMRCHKHRLSLFNVSRKISDEEICNSYQMSCRYVILYGALQQTMGIISALYIETYGEEKFNLPIPNCKTVGRIRTLLEFLTVYLTCYAHFQVAIHKRRSKSEVFKIFINFNTFSTVLPPADFTLFISC